MYGGRRGWGWGGRLAWVDSTRKGLMDKGSELWTRSLGRGAGKQPLLTSPGQLWWSASCGGLPAPPRPSLYRMRSCVSFLWLPFEFPQTGWLKATEIHSQSSGGQKSGISEGQVCLPRSLQGVPSLPLLVAAGIPWLAAASSQPLWPWSHCHHFLSASYKEACQPEKSRTAKPTASKPPGNPGWPHPLAYK